MDIVSRLFELQDIKYRDFQLKLTPGMTEEHIIGVRTPELKKLAKELSKDAAAQHFISELPHRYFEENQLHSFIISGIKDYKTALYETERFLPYIDNWATCDQLKPEAFRKNTDVLKENIRKWIVSDQTYTVRFGVEMLMNHYLGDNFFDEAFEWVIDIRSDEYYVNMMRAWYFATALAKQYDDTVKIFEENRLDKWTHNKSIQKARESFRVSDEHKEYLNGLKIK